MTAIDDRGVGIIQPSLAVAAFPVVQVFQGVSEGLSRRFAIVSVNLSVPGFESL